MKHAFATRASVLLAMLLAVACVSDKKHMRLYAGSARPSEEIATLLVVESLEVSSINGEHIPHIPRTVRSGERRLDLLPGGYDVIVYYDEVWQLNYSNEEIVHSETQLVSLELEAGHSYRLEHRPVIDLDAARLLARDLQVIVVDLSSGEPVRLAVASRPAVVSKPVVVKPIPARTGSAIAAPPAPGAKVVASGSSDVLATPTGASAAEVSQAIASLPLLKFWWQRASPGERAQFRGWIEE